MKKLFYLKLFFYFSLIGLIIFSLFFVLYIININKIDINAKELSNSFSVSRLYSNNPSYFSNNSGTNSSFNSFIIGIIKIDKIKLDYPILSKVSEDFLKIGPCRFAGPNPNEIGNLCIAGHNYLDNTFFAKISLLEKGDTIKIYGMDGSFVDYTVFDKREIENNDFSCTSQYTKNRKMVTLLTCNTLNNRKRIVQCIEKK